MSAKLDKVQLVKGSRWLERMDPLDNIGISTFTLIKEAIEEGRKDLATNLVDYLFVPEVKLVHDARGDWMWGWPSFIQKNYGEDQLYDAWSQVLQMMIKWRGGGRSEESIIAKRGTSAEDRLIWGYAVRNWSGHRMGKQDGLLGFIVKEYEDRLELDWDPCSSGGRMLRGDPIAGSPSKLGEPHNLGVTQKPHPWSWNKERVSLYCVHCCIAHEQKEVEQHGYLNWVIVPPTVDDPHAVCRWICYKDEDSTPTEYYNRIGKTKPQPTSPISQPNDPTKVLKVMNSGEFREYPYTKVKKEINAGNTKEALKALDELREITMSLHDATTRWHWAWMDYIVDKYGYNELYHALRSVDYSHKPPPPPGTPKFTKATIPNAEERARQAVLWARSDRSGPNGEGSVRIIDNPDKIVMEMDPCGSGGRMRLGDPTSGMTRAMDSPWNLKVTSVAHLIGWGKVGVPHFCTRCCVHEEMGAVVRTGYLTTVVEWPENPKDPCRWLFYKELDDIPEEYYTRIGAVKPAPQNDF